MIALRHLAEVNPSSPEFDALSADADVLFLPLETVWSDDRADQTRRVQKSTVDSGYTRFQAGDTVCPKVTPTFQAGRAMRARSVGAGTTELHILRPRPGVDPRWVTYAVRSKHFLEEGVTAFQGVAGLQRVPQEFVANFHVVDAPLEEQRRIADFLDDRVARIDQIITGRQAQSRLLTQLAAARLQKLQDEWTLRYGETRLGRVLVGLEQGWSPQAEATEAGPDEWGVMRAGCVNDGLFRPHDNKRLPDGLEPQRQYEIRSGDLLMSRASGSLDKIGSVAVVPAGVRNRLLLCDKIYRLRPARGWDAHYIAPMLRTHMSREAIRFGVSGAEGMANNLPSGVIRGLTVPLVPQDRQPECASAMERIEKQGREADQALVHSINLLSEYKQSLITAAVTGEIDVTTAGSGVQG